MDTKKKNHKLLALCPFLYFPHSTNPRAPHASHKNCKNKEIEKIALCLIEQSLSFLSFLRYCFGHGSHEVGESLAIIQYEESNGIDGLTIKVTNCVLW